MKNGQFRSNDMRLALVGACASLAGAIVGSAMTAIFTSTQTLRQERQSLYSQLVQEERSLLKSETDFWNLFRDHKIGFPASSEIQKKYEALEQAREKFADGSAAISLLASQSVIDLVTQDENAHQEFDEEVANIADRATQGESQEGEVAIDEKFNSFADPTLKISTQMLAGLRQEIGA